MSDEKRRGATRAEVKGAAAVFTLNMPQTAQREPYVKVTEESGEFVHVSGGRGQDVFATPHRYTTDIDHAYTPFDLDSHFWPSEHRGKGRVRVTVEFWPEVKP